MGRCAGRAGTLPLQRRIKQWRALAGPANEVSFVQAHEPGDLAASLWQCDFYAKKVLTLKGFRDLYLLVFLHVETRRVFIAPSTFHPNEAWVNEQARAFLGHVSRLQTRFLVILSIWRKVLLPSFVRASKTSAAVYFRLDTHRLSRPARLPQYDEMTNNPV